MVLVAFFMAHVRVFIDKFLYNLPVQALPVLPGYALSCN